MFRLAMIGNLGQDAVLRAANNGKVLNFSVAYGFRIRDRDGVLHERTTWVDCSLWDREVLTPYLVKGKLVYVEGMPAVETYINGAGLTIAQLKMRVERLRLLGGGREEGEAAVQSTADNAVEPGDDLPF